MVNLGDRWWVVHCTSNCFVQRKEPLYPMVRRLCGPQSWSGCFVEEKSLLLLPVSKTQIIQPIAWLLHWLSYSLSIFCHMSTCVCSSICWILMKFHMNIMPVNNANINIEVVMQGYYVIWGKFSIRICISVERTLFTEMVAKLWN
jgi:hypothetical protein